jgi:hypothetical protein
VGESRSVACISLSPLSHLELPLEFNVAGKSSHQEFGEKNPDFDLLKNNSR